MKGALRNARLRAEREGVPFDLSPDDIQIPDRCPILGIPLVIHDGEGRGPRDDSPSLDKIVPELGYVPGNITIVSSKANRLKSQQSPQEMLEFAKRYVEHHKEVRNTMQFKDFDREAPALMHAKLDRLWLVREDDGAVTHSCIVKDPDNPNVVFDLTISLTRAYP